MFYLSEAKHDYFLKGFELKNAKIADKIIPI